ncbi:MAG: hypothetical protein JWM89_233 [Acidimicrobiales bacterium]|nr:hypothetical protein [Acidimicrobiales bacterium]
MSDPDPEPEPQADEPKLAGHLDVEAERARLEELGKGIAETRDHIRDDLQLGGINRTFSDEGVARQMREQGDTVHPTGDSTGETGPDPDIG